jgi:Leu/Phe-tRNA-protein transferase
MKQTAVEWLVEFLALHGVNLDNAALNNVIKQAKDMEKGQIIESYCKGCFDMWKDDGIVPRETSEQYYNATYKSE